VGNTSTKLEWGSAGRGTGGTICVAAHSYGIDFSLYHLCSRLGLTERLQFLSDATGSASLSRRWARRSCCSCKSRLLEQCHLTVCSNLGYPTVPLSSRFTLVLTLFLSPGRGRGWSTGRGSRSGIGLRWQRDGWNNMSCHT
jgi:hypothetical protein